MLFGLTATARDTIFAGIIRRFGACFPSKFPLHRWYRSGRRSFEDASSIANRSMNNFLALPAQIGNSPAGAAPNNSFKPKQLRGSA